MSEFHLHQELQIIPASYYDVVEAERSFVAQTNLVINL